MNLFTFIKRMRYLIGTSEKPFATIYQLSSNDDMRSSGGVPGQIFPNKIKELSEEFLKYLSTAHEQIPAVKTLEEFQEWRTYYDSLIRYLNWFSTIGNMYLPKLESEQEIKVFYDDLIAVLNYFENRIDLEISLFFSSKKKVIFHSSIKEGKM